MAAITSNDVETRIKGKIQIASPEHLVINDLTATSCSTAFDVIVVSDDFKGKRLLQRHRLINDAIADIMPDIHAFTQKTMTIEEFEKKKAEA